MIKFYANNEIDKQKWDSCVASSQNGLIYAYAWYLDIVSPNWTALILDDYRAVFPLPIKKKLGISYISQPLFTQQLGLFSSDKEIALSSFLKAIPKKVWLRSLQIHNELDNAKTKDNFELNISSDIEVIRKKYSQNVKRNLKKSAEHNLDIKTCSHDLLIQLFKQNKGREVKEMNKKAYSILSELLDKIKQKQKGNCFGVYKYDKLISAAFFSNCLERSIYLFSASNSIAKEIGANHFLIDTYIENFKKDSLILDFEGSMIPSLARFYASFGAEKKHYFLINKR
ncbi:MAG: hypothetical protein H8E84_02000 [Flavobacteriales bacterium]|nr:hypothetical protein [Flavobacteriales bacterium]